jgi:VWFA-related protein
VSRHHVVLSALVLLIMAQADAQDVTIRTHVPLVIAPTTVTDRNGSYVDGLNAADFTLLEDGKARQFEMDTSDIAMTPLSVVIMIQANEYANAALAKIRKVGSMIEPLITGERGEAAIMSFSDPIKVIQDFTPDSGLISAAFQALRAQSTSKARALDAATQAIEMLRARPENRRRILILIGESRDRGSETKLEDVLKSAQRANVTVYPLSFSVHATPWTTKGDVPPGDGATNWLAIFTELGRLAKENAAEGLARFTGGRRISFLTLKSLERDIGGLGEELHSQYLLSFTPSTALDEAYHKIEIQVHGRTDVVVRTRPGYWAMTPQ